MTLDVLAFGILALLFALGLWRGALASGLSLAGLAVAYASAVLAAAVLGPLAAERSGLPELAAGPLAGAAVATLAFVLFAAFGSALKRREAERRGEAGRTSADRWLGGLFGTLRGCLVVVLLSYLAIWADAAARFGSELMLPSSQDSLAARVTGSMVEQVVEAAAGDGAAPRVLARFASRPGATLTSARELLDGEALRGVQGDAMFWTLLENGSVDRAANRLSFQRLLHDDEARRHLSELGLVSSDAAADPSRLRGELKPILEELAPKLRELKDDPEIQQLANDPEIVGLLHSGNTLALLTHPGVRAIAGRVAGSH